MNDSIEDESKNSRRNDETKRKIKENRDETDEALDQIHQEIQSIKSMTSPENELIRFVHTLQQLCQKESQEIQKQTRKTVLDYIEKFLANDKNGEDEEDVEQTEIAEDEQTNVCQPSERISKPEEPVRIVPSVQRSNVKVETPISNSSVPPPTVTPERTSSEEFDIRPNTRMSYQKSSSTAEQYRQRYSTISDSRKRQISAPIKGALNKLRKESLAALTKELFEFLNGQPQRVANESIAIVSEDERLLCLSVLSIHICAQLLGGDLNDAKSEVFLPLIGVLSENPQNREFSNIFLDYLHKKCPYTIPSYPKRQPTMDNEQYLKAMGYVEKQDGSERRLENEIEFLNRMSGLIRLFCKLLVRRGPPFDENLGLAWSWFSDVLNLPPRENITAVLIRIFLDESGEIMCKQYPTQFPKLIDFIQAQVLSRIKPLTSDAEMSRLLISLNAFKKKD